MKTNPVREKLIKDMLSILEEGSNTNWEQGWIFPSNAFPINLTTDNYYNGVNRLALLLEAKNHGYEDNRWATFNQIKEAGWKLKNAKGTGIKIEYYFPFDRTLNKSISWNTYKDYDVKQKDNCTFFPKFFTVFNATYIDGCPNLEFESTNNEINQNTLINDLIDKMKVEYIELPSLKSPFYSLSADRITMPLRCYFKDDYEFNSTLLHEAGHATGHENRLNRNLINIFGSKEYAFEELVAEITSSLMSNEFHLEQTQKHIDNHKAYVSDWISILKEKPNELFRAIKLSEEASDYMLDLVDKELLNAQTIEVNETQIVKEPTLQKSATFALKDGIEVLQYNGTNYKELEEFARDSLVKVNMSLGDNSGVCYFLKTAKGKLMIQERDYIIKDKVQSEIYHCKPEAFKEMYKVLQIQENELNEELEL